MNEIQGIHFGRGGDSSFRESRSIPRLVDLCVNVTVKKTREFTILTLLMPCDVHNNLMFGWCWKWLMLNHRFLHSFLCDHPIAIASPRIVYTKKNLGKFLLKSVTFTCGGISDHTYYCQDCGRLQTLSNGFSIHDAPISDISQKIPQDYAYRCKRCWLENRSCSGYQNRVGYQNRAGYQNMVGYNIRDTQSGIPPSLPSPPILLLTYRGGKNEMLITPSRR